MSKKERISFKYFLPGIAWFFIVGVLTLLPGKDVPDIKWFNFSYMDKLVHMALFGCLTLLFCLPYFKSHFSLQKKLNRFMWVGIFAFLWGVAVEVIQKYFITGRSFEWLDMVADGLGVLIAYGFMRKLVK